MNKKFLGLLALLTWGTPHPLPAAFSPSFYGINQNTDSKLSPTARLLIDMDAPELAPTPVLLRDVFSACDTALGGNNAGAPAVAPGAGQAVPADGFPAILPSPFRFPDAHDIIEVLRQDALNYATRMCYNFLDPSVGLGAVLDSMLAGLCGAFQATTASERTALLTCLDPGNWRATPEAEAFDIQGFTLENTVAMMAYNSADAAGYALQTVFYRVLNDPALGTNCRRSTAANHRAMLALHQYHENYVEGGFTGPNRVTSFSADDGLFGKNFDPAKFNPNALGILRAQLIPEINPVPGFGDSLFQILRTSDARLFPPGAPDQRPLAPRAAFFLQERLSETQPSSNEASGLNPQEIRNFAQLYNQLDVLLPDSIYLQQRLEAEAGAILRQDDPPATSFTWLYQGH